MVSGLQALEPSAIYEVLRDTGCAPDKPAVTMTGAELAELQVTLPLAASMLLKYTWQH